MSLLLWNHDQTWVLTIFDSIICKTSKVLSWVCFGSSHHGLALKINLEFFSMICFPSFVNFLVFIHLYISPNNILSFNWANLRANSLKMFLPAGVLQPCSHPHYDNPGVKNRECKWLMSYCTNEFVHTLLHQTFMKNKVSLFYPIFSKM